MLPSKRTRASPSTATRTSTIPASPLPRSSTWVWLTCSRATAPRSSGSAHTARRRSRTRRACTANVLPAESGRSSSTLVPSPPLQPTVAKGSVVVRDLRLWHAGMPNRTDDIRIVLAMIHFVPWYRQRIALDMPKSFEPLIARQNKLGISIPARFESDIIDHLNAGYGNSFDFDQDA